MSGQQGKAVDSIEHRVGNVEKEQALASERMKSSFDGFRNTLDNVQVEVRALVHKIDALADLRASHDSNRDAIEDVKDTIDKFTTRMETWFTDIENEQKDRWTKAYADRDAWRAAHEKDNQETKNKITMWSGIGFAMMLTGGMLVTGFVWVLNYRFNEQKELQVSDQHRTEEIQLRQADDIKANRDRFDSLKDRQHQIELLLARNSQQGTTP